MHVRDRILFIFINWMKNYCEQFVLCLAFTLMLIKGDISAMVGLYGDSIHFSGTISLIQINIKV